MVGLLKQFRCTTPGPTTDAEFLQFISVDGRRQAGSKLRGMHNDALALYFQAPGFTQAEMVPVRHRDTDLNGRGAQIKHLPQYARTGFCEHFGLGSRGQLKVKLRSDFGNGSNETGSDITGDNVWSRIFNTRIQFSPVKLRQNNDGGYGCPASHNDRRKLRLIDNGLLGFELKQVKDSYPSFVYNAILAAIAVGFG